MLQASLKVIGGKNDGKLIEFKSSKFLVGREQDCHLRPNSDLVSRHHCVFTLDDYTLRLRDLGSTNGTLVNGRRIRGEIVLTPGDVVKIGKLNLEVVIGQPAFADFAPPIPSLETTTNSSVVDTAFDMPGNSGQTVLEDSGMFDPASGDTAHIDFSPTVDGAAGADGEVPLESDTLISGARPDQTHADHPIIPPQPPTVPDQPAVPPQHPAMGQAPTPQYPPPEAMPPNAWQYPPQYPQYPQYQQYPPGYPMGYPPGYPPGYGYPPQQPGQYPPNYPQPPQPEPPPAKNQAKAGGIPEVRLPNPEETGAKEVPKPPPAAEGDQPPKSPESTPSTSAADLIKSSRKRRRPEEE